MLVVSHVQDLQVSSAHLCMPLLQMPPSQRGLLWPLRLQSSHLPSPSWPPSAAAFLFYWLNLLLYDLPWCIVIYVKKTKLLCLLLTAVSLRPKRGLSTYQVFNKMTGEWTSSRLQSILTCSQMAPVMVTGKGLTFPRPKFSRFLWLLNSFSSLFSSSSRELQYRTWTHRGQHGGGFIAVGEVLTSPLRAHSLELLKVSQHQDGW